MHAHTYTKEGKKKDKKYSTKRNKVQGACFVNNREKVSVKLKTCNMC